MRRRWAYIGYANRSLDIFGQDMLKKDEWWKLKNIEVMCVHVLSSLVCVHAPHVTTEARCSNAELLLRIAREDKVKILKERDSLDLTAKKLSRGLSKVVEISKRS
ncbi:hypothetical protein BUALT_Bualt12G0071900 [Buddleja alternifolia]|uniref:Uncharacterized protein n=1 Tax=Buddleja alternifolia TaxID=168488 RepID=A0AAV6WP50_9LAMI|nr:hypothetical protein BUALT_Bualt12G0071900 [Buddleja alternifolia]